MFLFFRGLFAQMTRRQRTTRRTSMISVRSSGSGSGNSSSGHRRNRSHGAGAGAGPTARVASLVVCDAGGALSPFRATILALRLLRRLREAVRRYDGIASQQKIFSPTRRKIFFTLGGEKIKQIIFCGDGKTHTWFQNLFMRVERICCSLSLFNIRPPSIAMCVLIDVCVHTGAWYASADGPTLRHCT
jgi:hypothetical protein